MTIKEANLKIGDVIRFPPWKNLWRVNKIVERGVITELAIQKKDVDPHKHLDEWHMEIEVVSRS